MIRFILIVTTICLFACDNVSLLEEDFSRIENLMENRPDSALYILGNIDKSRLTSEKDIAHYSLLYVQAQDKNYIVYSDSTSYRAMNYYRRTKDELRKAYAYYYYAHSCFELGNIDKGTESLTYAKNAANKTSDNKLKGLVAHSYADRYYIQLDLENALQLYLESANYFLQSKDLKSAQIAFSDAANCYNYLGKEEDAILYYNKARELAIQLGNSEDVISILAVLQYLGVDVTTETNYSFDELLYKSNNIAKYYSVLGGIYYNANKLNSARRFLRKSYENTTDYSTNNFGLLLLLSRVEEKLHNYKEALEYHKQYYDIADSLYLAHSNKTIQELEHKYNTKLISESYEMLKIRHTYMYVIIVLTSFIFIIIIITIVLMARKKAKQKLMEIVEYQTYIEDGKSQYEALNKRYIQLVESNQTNDKYMIMLQELLHNRIQSLQVLSYYAYKYESQPDKFYSKFKNHMKLSQASNNEFATDFMAMADIYCNGVISHLKSLYPTLSAYELSYCSFVCLGFTPESIRILLNHSNVYSIYTLRAKIRNKMAISSSVGTLEKYILGTLEQLRSNNI